MVNLLEYYIRLSMDCCCMYTYDGPNQPSLYNLNICEIVHSVLCILSFYNLNIAERVQAYNPLSFYNLNITENVQAYNLNLHAMTSVLSEIGFSSR